MTKLTGAKMDIKQNTPDTISLPVEQVLGGLPVNRLYGYDCLDFLKMLPSGCCDVFTDPPYNVGKEYGHYKDDLKPEDYLKWIEEVLTEIKRVSIIATIYTPHKWTLQYWNILGPEFKQIILPFSPAGAIRYGFSNQFNFLLTNAKPKKPIRNVWPGLQQPGLGWFFREETYGHPGYTSYEVTRHAIHKLSENDIICDPFIGTGTTAIAAINENKCYIGCDSNNWLKTARQRIDNELIQTNCFPGRYA